MQTRPPPHNLEREEALLGSMFLNGKIKPYVKQRLSWADLYREANQYIFSALLSTESDLVSVVEWLKEKGLLEKVGGPDYVAHIVDETSTSLGYQFHCERIKDLSKRRQIIAQCADTANQVWDLTYEVDETLSAHKNGIRDIQADHRPDYTPNNVLIDTVFKDIEARKKSGNQFVGVKTGFDNIDKHLFGLEPKTTTYLIARPSMGKTALALNVADNVAMNNPGKVLFFSLESGETALTRRRLASRSGVYLTRIRTGGVDDSQWSHLIEAANTLADNSLIILNRPKFKTVENLCSMAETLAMENPISLIVVDHIQRMRSKQRFNNRHLELSYVSEELTSLVSELNAPGLILCQLSREVDKRRDKRPRLSDMKESGDLEQNADNVIGLYREDKKAELAEIDGLKGRDVGTWKKWLSFDRFIQKFSDCADQDSSIAGTYMENEI